MITNIIAYDVFFSKFLKVFAVAMILAICAPIEPASADTSAKIAPHPSSIGNWCNRFPQVVIQISEDGAVDMDSGRGRAHCRLHEINTQVYCTYPHMPAGYFHLYSLRPDEPKTGFMTLEQVSEQHHEVHEIHRCDPQTLHELLEHAQVEREQRGDPFLGAPEQGKHTWSVEGESNVHSRFYSRRLHRLNWGQPHGALSVAIGRGYQLGYRTCDQIRSDLRAVGVEDERVLETLCAASGLSGEDADKFLAHHHADATLTLLPEQERKLFELQWAQALRDAMRRVGARVWNEELPPSVQKYLLDLQPILANENWSALMFLVSDSAFWVEDLGMTNARFEMHQQLISNLAHEVSARNQVIQPNADASAASSSSAETKGKDRKLKREL